VYRFSPEINSAVLLAENIIEKMIKIAVLTEAEASTPLKKHRKLAQYDNDISSIVI
jgi:hypothetical protein